MTQTATAREARLFGKCVIPGCKHRVVANHNQYDWAARHFFDQRCPTHNVRLDWTPLKGRYNAQKECGSRCMASIGPSCSCACGGENHGANHL